MDFGPTREKGKNGRKNGKNWPKFFPLFSGGAKTHASAIFFYFGPEARFGVCTGHSALSQEKVQERTNIHFSNVHFVLCQSVGLGLVGAARPHHPFLSCLLAPTASVALGVSSLRGAIMNTKEGSSGLEETRREMYIFERCTFVRSLRIHTLRGPLAVFLGHRSSVESSLGLLCLLSNRKTLVLFASGPKKNHDLGQQKAPPPTHTHTHTHTHICK